MYNVKIEHFKPDYRKGNLESALSVIDIKSFKTKKLAKEYIEKELIQYKIITKQYNRRDGACYCLAFTGKTWTNESTGEKCNEFFKYLILK